MRLLCDEVPSRFMWPFFFFFKYSILNMGFEHTAPRSRVAVFYQVSQPGAPLSCIYLSCIFENNAFCLHCNCLNMQLKNSVCIELFLVTFIIFFFAWTRGCFWVSKLLTPVIDYLILNIILFLLMFGDCVWDNVYFMMSIYDWSLFAGSVFAYMPSC